MPSGYVSANRSAQGPVEVMARRAGLAGVLLVWVGLARGQGVDPDDAPKITWPTQHGMIIDAGSTGSRMHVYEWNSRRFRTVPPPFSYPLTSNRWTDRLA